MKNRSKDELEKQSQQFFKEKELIKADQERKENELNLKILELNKLIDNLKAEHSNYLQSHLTSSSKVLLNISKFRKSTP